MTRSPAIASPVWLAVASGGLIIWASSFVFLYAGLSIGCALGWHHVTLLGANALTVLLAALWLVHLVLQGCFQWYALGLWKRATGPNEGVARFIAGITCLIAATGLASTVFIGAAVLVLPPCA